MLDIIVDVFLDIVCYALGAITLPVVTFGKCYASKMVWVEKTGLSVYKWHGIRQDEKGRYEFSESVTQIVGFVVFVTILAALVFLGYKKDIF